MWMDCVVGVADTETCFMDCLPFEGCFSFVIIRAFMSVRGSQLTLIEFIELP